MKFKIFYRPIKQKETWCGRSLEKKSIFFQHIKHVTPIYNMFLPKNISIAFEIFLLLHLANNSIKLSNMSLKFQQEHTKMGIF